MEWLHTNGLYFSFLSVYCGSCYNDFFNKKKRKRVDQKKLIFQIIKKGINDLCNRYFHNSLAILEFQ